MGRVCGDAGRACAGHGLHEAGPEKEGVAAVDRVVVHVAGWVEEGCSSCISFTLFFLLFLLVFFVANRLRSTHEFIVFSS